MEALKDGKGKDHPRVCGEQNINIDAKNVSEGSPPRVRGTARYKYIPPVCERITPACAGNRTACIAEYGVWEDHPRVCGEQSCILSG